jgi:hypothetical protein
VHVLAILTLVAAGLIVAALAAYLISVALLLRRASLTLGTINVGLRSIAARVEPLEPILGEINADLTEVRDALSEVLYERETSV